MRMRGVDCGRCGLWVVSSCWAAPVAARRARRVPRARRRSAGARSGRSCLGSRGSGVGGRLAARGRWGGVGAEANGAANAGGTLAAQEVRVDLVAEVAQAAQ